MPRGGPRPGAGRPRKGEEKIVRSQFTSAEIEKLLDSPHIAYVSRTTISYTLAFKELFWQRHCDGVHPLTIFEEAGLDTKIIGRSRVDWFLRALKDQKERGLSFNEGSEPHQAQPPKQFNIPSPPRRLKNSQVVSLSPEAIARMAHEVAYMKQELEFIKKIILAGMQGGSS